MPWAADADEDQPLEDVNVTLDQNGELAATCEIAGDSRIGRHDVCAPLD